MLREVCEEPWVAVSERAVDVGVAGAGVQVQAGRVQASRIVSPGISRTIALGTTTQRPLTAGGREVVKLVREIVSTMVGSGPWQQPRE